jgi:hypothetical protein
MIGSGAITSAHKIVEAEGPRTGSFSAKQGEEPQPPKRPSVIVTDAPAAGTGQFRPARLLHVTQPTPPPPPPPAPAQSAVSKTPTPRRAHETLGKRSRGGLRPQHWMLLLLGIGAAIFAALVTIGFVNWWRARDKPSPDETGMKGSPLDDRHDGRSRIRSKGHTNTGPKRPVQATRETEHITQSPLPT